MISDLLLEERSLSNCGDAGLENVCDHTCLQCWPSDADPAPHPCQHHVGERVLPLLLPFEHWAWDYCTRGFNPVSKRESIYWHSDIERQNFSTKGSLDSSEILRMNNLSKKEQFLCSNMIVVLV